MKQRIDKITVREMYESGLTTREVADLTDIGNATVYRWCKDIIRPKTVTSAGEKNGSYKGFVHITEDGYRKVRVNGKYIFEHRIIMEKHIGRTISKDEIIHHINNDKGDNRIENLQLTTREEHRKIHARESKPRVCIVCRKMFYKPSSESIGQWEQRKTCSRECKLLHMFPHRKGGIVI